MGFVMFLIKSILQQTWFIFFLCLCEFGQSTEYNWFANLRFRGRADKFTALGTLGWNTQYSTITEMRSRLGLNVIGNNSSAKFILQDSRLFGHIENNSGVTNSSGTPFFHQAFFTFSNLNIPWFQKDFIQIGRFELALGNQRIIAKNDWNNIGRSFEGILGASKVRNNWFSGDLLLMHLFINETLNSDKEDVSIFGFYWNEKIPRFGEKSHYEFYLLNFRNMKFDSVDDTTASYNNIGTRIDVQKNNWILEAESAFQTSMGASSKDLVEGNLLSFNLGYKLENMGFFKNIILGVDQISGDDSATYVGEGFSKEFGAIHKHHGYYDYTSHKKYFGHHHEGLKEINLKANLNIFPNDKKKTNLLIALHDFKSGVDDIHYGSEIDFIFKTKHNNEISSEFGTIFYFPTIGNENRLSFYYFIITANF